MFPLSLGAHHKFGGGSQLIHEPRYPHDFIELSPRTQQRIYEKCAPLYTKGLSIRDIEAQTGIPKTTVREALTKSGMVLRNHMNGKASKTDRTKNKRGGHTLYGHAYLDGQLIIDPKEQIIVRKILKLRHEGKTFQAIADHLNDQKAPTRSGKPWIKSVIRSIVLRSKGKIK